MNVDTIRAVTGQITQDVEHRREGVVRLIHEFTTTQVHLWRTGTDRPTYQGAVHANGLKGWAVQFSRGTRTGTSDRLSRDHNYPTKAEAIDALIAHDSQRPSTVWPEQTYVIEVTRDGLWEPVRTGTTVKATPEHAAESVAAAWTDDIGGLGVEPGETWRVVVAVDGAGPVHHYPAR